MLDILRYKPKNIGCVIALFKGRIHIFFLIIEF